MAFFEVPLPIPGQTPRKRVQFIYEFFVGGRVAPIDDRVFFLRSCESGSVNGETVKVMRQCCATLPSVLVRR